MISSIYMLYLSQKEDELNIALLVIAMFMIITYQPLLLIFKRKRRDPN
jgi:hypothetical protein